MGSPPKQSRIENLNQAAMRHSTTRECVEQLMIDREQLCFETRSLPPSLAASLAVLPSMSPIPSSSIVLIRSNHETLDRLAGDKSIHNLGDVRGRNAPVEKVIGFD